MKSFRRVLATPLVAALVVLAATPMALASSGPKWSTEQLADFSAAIVTGRVSAIVTATDASGVIYTYVSVDITEVLKGSIAESQVVLKQAGGIVGELGLNVPGQATFSMGEEVLVFAEVRPRDATLYTTALWQGKWVLETDAVSGAREAVQRDASIRNGSSEMARADFASLRESLITRGAQDQRVYSFDAIPSETPSGSQSPFNLFSTPMKWRTLPARYDVQSGGQPGLGGGGLTEIGNAVTQWNAPSNFKWNLGSLAGTVRCGETQPTSLATNFLMIEANDPCAEISDSGGTLAVAFSWFTTAIEETFNGVGFRRMIQVTIITNDSPTAQQFVTNSNCFNQVMLHEMGHALGLDHSGVATAVMAPTVSFPQCSAAARPLQSDDIAGVQFIYNATTVGAPGQPVVTSAVAAGGVLTVQWTSGAGGAPTVHSLGFYSGATPLGSITSGPATSFSVPLPPGTQGTFGVTVTPANNAGIGPTSPLFPFTIGGGAPGQPTVTSANASGGILTINWTSGAGTAPTGHRLDFFQAGAPVANLTVGAATSVGLPLPAGVQGAFAVQVTALNGAIAGPPSPLFDFTIGTSCTVPTAPAVSGGIVNGTANISWPAVAGATGYIVSAGTTPGGTQFLAPSNIGLLTSLGATGLPPGFQAFVRVIAVNACGQQGPPTDFLLQ